MNKFKYAVFVVLLAGAQAAIKPPDVKGPIPVTANSQMFGAEDFPGGPPSANLAAHGYVEEEYFVSGKANIYQYDSNWNREVKQSDVPYTTRLVIRKPKDPARFSGNVQFECGHPQQGNTSHWRGTKAYIMRHGDIYATAMCGADQLSRSAPKDAPPTAAPFILKWFDAKRYAPIDWPDDDGIRYDVISQIGALLKSNVKPSPVTGYKVERMYTAGWSFTGSQLRVYINEGFHEEQKIFDGYLIGISASAAGGGYNPLNNAQRLPVGNPRRFTKSIDVPVIELMSENEAPTNTGPQAPESDDPKSRHRLYEVPGLSHGDGLGDRSNGQWYQLNQRNYPGAVKPPDCDLKPSDVPMGDLASAALANLDEWVRHGTPPPHAERIKIDPATKLGLKDPIGNTQGGLRVAQLDVPLARYGDYGNESNAACRTSPFMRVKRVPLSKEELAGLYKDKNDYLNKFSARVDRMVKERWLLPEDAKLEIEAGRKAADSAFHESAVSEPRVSRPGIYSGYSQPLYSEWVRSSQYVEVRDGTRLAVDVYRPAANKQAIPGRYPVVWMFTPYQRASVAPDGQLRLTQVAPMLDLTKYGYVVAIADVRGRGASYGWRRGFQDQTEAKDGYDLNEWFAKQPWSSGKLGMAGCSYLGGSQMEVLTTTPPHLKAIFPGCTDFEKYDMNVRGGLTGQFGTSPKGTPSDPTPEMQLTTAPVDVDKDRSMLREAVAQHARGTPLAELWKEIPYRDDWSSLTQSRYFLETSLATYLENIHKSGIAVYNWGNWQDEESEGVIMSFINIQTPRKLWMGGWGHCQVREFDMVAEQRRFFDYWLKGIDNGIMNEPAVYYYTVNAPQGQQWHAAKQWPLPEEKRTNFYFHSGLLAESKPSTGEKSDTYTVDYTVSCKTPPSIWPCSLDEKALTYTTPPLNTDIEVTGHPVVHLWISSTSLDGHFFAALEDVDVNGTATVIAPGRLRAMVRQTNQPPYNYLGLPWHRANRSDAKPLEPGVPAELVFTLEPTSTLFRAGHNMRVTITGADPRERNIAVENPAPVITVYHDAAHPSYVTLPVIAKRTQ